MDISVRLKVRHCPEAAPLLPELGEWPAKCRPPFLSSLGSHPNPIYFPQGCTGRCSRGLHAPSPRSFKKSKTKSGTYRFSFQARRAEPRMLGGTGGARLPVGNVAALRWGNGLRAVPPRLGDHPVRERVPGPDRSASLCLGYPICGPAQLWVWGRHCAHGLGPPSGGAERVGAGYATSPVLGQLEVARAQELAQHRVEVRSSG